MTLREQTPGGTAFKRGSVAIDRRPRWGGEKVRLGRVVVLHVNTIVPVHTRKGLLAPLILIRASTDVHLVSYILRRALSAVYRSLPC